MVEAAIELFCRRRLMTYLGYFAVLIAIDWCSAW